MTRLPRFSFLVTVLTLFGAQLAVAQAPRSNDGDRSTATGEGHGGSATDAGNASAAARAAAGTEQLSVDERGRLEAGFLVTRPRSEQRGLLRLIGGTAFQLIDLPADVVWRQMDDPSDYWQILPAARESRETAHDEVGDRTVFIRHAYGPASATYSVRMHFEPSTHTVVFRLADDLPHSIVAGWGFFRLVPWTDHRTLVQWGVLADPGHGMLVDAFRPKIHEMLLRVPLKLRRHLGFPDPEPVFPSERAEATPERTPKTAETQDREVRTIPVSSPAPPRGAARP